MVPIVGSGLNCGYLLLALTSTPILKRGNFAGCLQRGDKNRHLIKMQQEVIMAIEEGKAAPAFSLPDATGNKVSLNEFSGKNVIVYFYPKDNTSG
jgi:cytochrome oxidase Cu insertion factor (SCO1/SenC/PrrC family)